MSCPGAAHFFQNNQVIMSRLSQWAKTEKEKISNIPDNGKRAAYIWEYYKLWIIGIVFLIWFVAFSIHQYTTTMHDYWCYMMFNNTYADAGNGSDIWEVPYLAIDPADIGRQYEPIVRINSQSGKGGVAFVMDNYFGFKIPKAMRREFADVIQAESEKQGEVSPDQIMDAFRKTYLDRKEPLHFRRLQVTDLSNETTGEFDTKVTLTYTDHGQERSFEAVGNGPLDAVRRGVRENLHRDIRILDYTEHALTSGSDSQAAAYIHMMDENSGTVTWGVGVSSNITRASVRAMFSAMNRIGGQQPGVRDL